MNVWKVPDSLADKYHGSGHALAAVAGGQLVGLVYLAEVIPDFDEDSLQSVLSDERLGPTVRYLSALGEVSIGMCSCWEFIEL
jgi:hypothetical protein